MPGDDDNCRGAVADSFKCKEMEEEGSLQNSPGPNSNNRDSSRRWSSSRAKQVQQQEFGSRWRRRFSFFLSDDGGMEKNTRRTDRPRDGGDAFSFDRGCSFLEPQGVFLSSRMRSRLYASFSILRETLRMNFEKKLLAENWTFVLCSTAD